MTYLVLCSANLTGAADRTTTDARKKRTSAESSREGDPDQRLHNWRDLQAELPVRILFDLVAETFTPKHCGKIGISTQSL
jgi:hypothetical protein